MNLSHLSSETTSVHSTLSDRCDRPRMNQDEASSSDSSDRIRWGISPVDSKLLYRAPSPTRTSPKIPPRKQLHYDRPFALSKEPSFYDDAASLDSRATTTVEDRIYNKPMPPLPALLRESHHDRREIKPSPIYVSSSWTRPLIPVLPGYNVPLRGREETWEAYCQNLTWEVECLVCQTFLYCIQSASLVICPHCRLVSPTNSPFATESLGLGMTPEIASEEYRIRRQQEPQYGPL